MSDLLGAIQGVLTTGDIVHGADATNRLAGVWRSDLIKARIIVRPTTTEEVSAVMKLCHARGQRVVVHGGLTGLVHAADTAADDVVISTERLNRIEDLDRLGRTLTVQAGVPLQLIHEAAEGAGFMFPVDLGARGSCQIGGNVSTNAGGLRVIRYGMTRDNVLGLEAVLADGTVVSSMNRMLKNNSGYDIKQLFIGSEGTLGIVTRLVLRLRTALPARHTALVAFPNFEAVLKVLSFLDGALSGNLSAYEVMWPDFFLFQREKVGGAAHQIDGEQPFYGIVETLGSDQEREADAFAGALAEAMDAGLISDALIAKSDSERASIWRIRDEVEHLLSIGQAIFFDVSLAQPPMEAYVAKVRKELHEALPGVTFFSYGHLGDGNLHFTVCTGSDTETHRHTIERVIYEPLAALSGSVSAEHGIGLEKKPWLGICRSDNEIALMRRLKHALDPQGILNPGKIFEYDGQHVPH